MTKSIPIRCRQQDCFASDIGCSNGELDFTKCPNYLKQEMSVDTPSNTEDEETFPWTSRPMGSTDLRFISATRRPHFVGIAGAADSGKTTLLSLLFLAIYKGHNISKYRFAGSYSLLAWENIAKNLQLNAGDAIQFPPHTTSSGRIPGLLHLNLANTALDQRDIILTDASGEWFTTWATNPDDKTASGAKWVALHSDRILILADTESLTKGDNRGAKRQALEFLIRRIKSESTTTEVALVWTKSDLERPAQLTEKVESHFKSCFPNAPIFSTGIPNSENNRHDTSLQELDTLFSWAFEKHTQKVLHHLPESTNEDPFILYREAL